MIENAKKIKRMQKKCWQFLEKLKNANMPGKIEKYPNNASK